MFRTPASAGLCALIFGLVWLFAGLPVDGRPVFPRSQTARRSSVNPNYFEYSSSDHGPASSSVMLSSSTEDEGQLVDQGFQLDYQVEVVPNLVRLNDEMDIEAVRCLSNATLEIVSVSGNVNWPAGTILNGGEEWGCLSDLGQPEVILRKVERTSVVSANTTLVTTSPASIAECFSNANIRFKMGSVVARNPVPQSSVRTQQAEKPTHTNKASTSPITVLATPTIASPVANSVYYVGDSVNLRWAYSGADMEVEVILYWDQFGFDTNLYSVRTRLKNGAAGLTVPIQRSYRSSNLLYFYMKWNCGILSCDNSRSPGFIVPQSAVIIEPFQGNRFEPGAQTTLAWIKNGLSDTSFTVELMREGSVAEVTFEQKFATFPNVVNNGQATLIFPDSSVIKRSNTLPYFFRFQTSEGKIESPRFYFLQPGSVTITAPEPEQVYHEGDDILVRWDYEGQDMPVTVEIWRRVTLLPDERMYSAPSMLSQGKQGVIISVTNSLVSKGYLYVYLTYSNPARHAESNAFKVPYLVTVTSPSSSMPVVVGENVEVKWLQNGVASDTDMSLSLRRVAALFDDTIKEYGATKNTGSRTVSIPQNAEPHLFRYYFQLSYDCWLGWCSKSNSPTFQIPLQKYDDWNYDTVQRQAIDSVELVNTNCSTLQSQCDMCRSSPKSCNQRQSLECVICGEGRELTLQASCTDCWAKYHYTIAEFELKISALSVDHFYFTGYGDIALNAELFAKITYSLSGAGKTKVLDKLNVMGKSFSVAGAVISLGVFLSLDSTYAYSAKAQALASMAADMKSTFNVTTTYTPATKFQTVSDIKLEKSYLKDTVIEANADLTAEVGLIPTVTFTIVNLVTAEVQTTAYLKALAFVSYPAFAPLTQSYDLPAEYLGGVQRAPLIHAGSCAHSHLVRYGVVAGVRDTMAHLDVSFGLWGFNLIKYNQSVDFEEMSLGPYPIVSGCMAPVKERSEVVTVQFVNTFVLDVSSAEQLDAFKYRFTDDVSRALGMQPHQLYIQQIKNGQIVFEILGNEQQSPKALADQFREQLSSEGSDLRRSSVTQNLNSSSMTQEDGPEIEIPEDLPPPAPANAEPSSSLPLIIGVAAGGVALLSAVAGLIFMVRRRRMRQQAKGPNSRGREAPVLDPISAESVMVEMS